MEVGLIPFVPSECNAMTPSTVPIVFLTFLPESHTPETFPPQTPPFRRSKPPACVTDKGWSTTVKERKKKLLEEAAR